MNIKKPGHCEISTKNDIRLFKKIIKFVESSGKCAEIGKENIKMNYIKNYLGIKITQVDAQDFNFNILKGSYDTIFCFEILEHLQNPLWFMAQLKSILKHRGIIYLSMPCRPKLFWSKYHFFEMHPKHFQKWILNPLDLKIIKKKKIFFSFDGIGWHLIGIRPLLRLFYNYTIIYKIQ